MGSSHVVHHRHVMIPPYTTTPNAIIANLDSLYREVMSTDLTLSQARHQLLPITTAAMHILPRLPPDVAATLYYNVRHQEDAILNAIRNR